MPIHPTAIVDDSAIIGKNVKIGAFCEIRANVTIGDNTTFGSRCTISAGATIGKNCTIKYGFVLTDTPDISQNDKKEVGSIGDNVLIGANVTLMPAVNLADNCIVGACSQVRHDVEEGQTVYGNPAK